VMLNARTRNIKTLRTKMEKRFFGAVENFPLTINDGVVDFIEGWPRNRIRDITCPACLRSITNVADVFRRNPHIRLAHKDIARIVFRQAGQLLMQVVTNDIGLRYRRAITTRLINVAKRLRPVDGAPLAEDRKSVEE